MSSNLLSFLSLPTEGREGRNRLHITDEETEAQRSESICFQVVFLQEERGIVVSEDAGSAGDHLVSRSSLSPESPPTVFSAHGHTVFKVFSRTLCISPLTAETAA